MPSSVQSSQSQLGIILYGGLGNQLFQFAAAYSIKSNLDCKLYFDLLGETNNGPDGLPEILELGRISKVDIRQRGQLSRAAGKRLSRASIILSSINPNSISKKVLRKILSVINVAIFDWILKSSIRYPAGVGFDSKFADRVLVNSTIIGNFQSYKWISSETKNHLIEEFGKTQFSEKVSQLKARAKISKPIAVHIRLGDYESIDDLNVVTEEYFNTALAMLTKNATNEEIWIFTNDLEKSKKYVSTTFQKNAFWIPESLNSLETLEVMRHCHSFVISNSTFSWWAAFLANKPDPVVIAPKVWIKNHPEPVEICPPDWGRI
jgi:hypothetical protein